MAAVTAPAVGAQERQAPPCSAPEYDHFDFWVGEWDVHRPDGKLAGRNTIARTMNGCVLHESYDAAAGPYHGESFNTWDAGRGVWHQSWVDNGGLLLKLDGGLRDGKMVMEGEVVRPDGTVSLNRITWSTIDGDPDRVRQLWESSTDGGESWKVVFDGEYRRRGG